MESQVEKYPFWKNEPLIEMTLGGLFSGIGGFELAAQWAGITPLWSNEIDKRCCQVLRKRFNHEIIQEDIRKIGSGNLMPVDIICGGFPCQPFSSAGHRRGKEDDRYLWPEMLRIIKELRPAWVIGENVAGLASMGQPGVFSHLESEEIAITEESLVLPEIIQSLEEAGYRVQVLNIPACAYYAEHRRERLWIIAYGEKWDDWKCNRRAEERQEFKFGECFSPLASADPIGSGLWTKSERYLGMERNTLQRSEWEENTNRSAKIHSSNVAHAASSRSEGQQKPGSNQEEKGTKQDKQNDRLGASQRWWEWEAKPVLCRENDGLPGRLDRLKQLGNAIYVPIAYELLRSIKSLY